MMDDLYCRDGTMRNDKDRYWDCLDQAMEASHGGRTDEALAWLDEALKRSARWRGSAQRSR